MWAVSVMTTRTERVLWQMLPATIPEMAAIDGCSVRAMNAAMQHLKYMGRAKPTDRRGLRYGKRGPKPKIWVLT